MRIRTLYKRIMSTFLMASLIGCQSKVISDPFLEGDSIKIRVSDRGTLGGEGTGVSTDNKVMLRFDKTGTGSFSNTSSTSPDYFQSSPSFEGFSVEFTKTRPGWVDIERININGTHNHIGNGSLTDKSGIAYENLTFDNRLIWETSGTAGSGIPFDISHDYMFNDSSSFVLINTKITALDDLEELNFARFGNPNPGRERLTNGSLGSNETINTRDSQNSVTAVSLDNQFAITLATNENNSVGAGISGDNSIGFQVLSGTTAQTHGRYYLAATESSSTGDETIGLGFQFNNISAGDTQSFFYAYCVGEDVTASRNQCNNVAFSVLTDDGDATYSISGTASTGQTLSTSATTADPDGNGSITSYTWQSSSDGSNWTTIGTSSTYTITSSEEGKSIKVVVAYTDGESNSESVTASSVSIAHVDSGDATYLINGTSSTGQTLSTSATTADPDGNGSITSYTWQSSSDGSNWTTIGTSSTYTITSSEEGKSIRVVVAYTDGESHSESVTASSVSIAHVDSGDAVFAISGTTSVGQVLSASQSSSDPDGDGTFSYQWQSSSDNSTWTNISGATNSTYTVSESEDGKYIRLVVTYTDSQNFSETVIASSVSIRSQLNNDWLQPFAAMQSVGLTSIKNNRDLVLAKAGECNNYGWVIDETDFCLYSNSSNSISYVTGDSNYGGYDYSNFNTSIIIEKTFNEEWKAGISYGVGSSNLNNFNFSGTTANFHSTNTHYSIYGFKQVSKKFSLKGLIGVSDFDYSGNRNYLNTTAESTYDADGYTAEIIGTWDFNKFIKESNALINVKPSIGIAFAAHTQDGFSESGSGDLVTIKSNQAESLLFKAGLKVENQILMEGGKWILIPSLDLNYEFDALASSNNRKIAGVVKDSSDDTTFVSSKTLGEHYVSAKVGTDFIVTENLSFNLNAKYVLTDGGNQHSYGCGFSLVF